MPKTHNKLEDMPIEACIQFLNRGGLPSKAIERWGEEIYKEAEEWAALSK